MKRIRKAIFPVAGLGTRFLPATKAMPKEMLTVVDRPVIQHVVDEARAAGIEHFIFVTGRNKGVIEDHFDKQFELEATLERRGKTKELLELQKDLPSAGQTSFTRQQEPLGLGHAVWCARDIVGDEPFALLLPDMLHHGPSCLAGMMEVYNKTGGNVIAVNEVPKEQVHQYGIVGVGEKQGTRLPDYQHGRKAEGRGCAVELLDFRPVHTSAGDLRAAVEAGGRRGRRNPADRFHADARQDAKLLGL